jgi:ferredoxin--NADP+ reductase
VREVVIAARRGPEHSAFTLPELIGLTSTAEVVLAESDRDAVQRDLATVTDTLTKQKLEVLSTLGPAEKPATSRPRIRLAYNLTPQRVLGEQRASGIEFGVTGTDEVQTIDAGLVLTSIGYHGQAIKDLPFDDEAGVVPNNGGRVMLADTPVEGAYVAGWIKRGPTGFIGTNKSCAAQTVQRLVDDYNGGQLHDPVGKLSALDRLVRQRQPDVVDANGWRAIDAAELARGEVAERPRNKFTSIAEMLDVADAAPTPSLRSRIADRLRDMADLA